MGLNSHPVTAVKAGGVVRGAVAVDKAPIRSSPVTSRIQPPKLICIVPSNPAGVWVGGHAIEREKREERKPALACTLAWTAIWARCNPGGFLHEALASHDAGRCATSCSSTVPAPAVEVRSANGSAGRAISSTSGGRLAGPPRLEKIPRPCSSSPHHQHQQTCMRPIERPAWCDGHFQGPDREIDTPGYSFRLVSWTFEKP